MKHEDYTNSGYTVAMYLIAKTLDERGSDAALNFGYGMLLAMVRIMWGGAKKDPRGTIQKNVDQAVDWAEKAEANGSVVVLEKDVPPKGGVLH